MISNFLGRTRGASVLTLVLLVVSLGARPALAADDSASGDEKKAPAADSADDSAKAPAAVPQLQLDDEGPSARAAKKPQHHLQLAAPLATDESDDKPFYKTWQFWAVTGVLVAGAVGAIIYSTSGTRGSLDPCPANVTLSLGCFGAGRM